MAAPNPPSAPASTTTLLLLAAAFPFQTVFLAAIIGLPSAGRFTAPLEGSDYVIAAVAIGAVAASVVLAGQKLAVRETIGEDTPKVPIAQFQTDMLICLAFAELCALLGIFIILPRDASTGWTLVAASIGAQLFGILPHVFAYVRSQKS